MKLYTCKICGCQKAKLKAHFRIVHGLTEQEYYDLCVKQPGEGICPVCGKPTNFIDWIQGYRTHCSTSCSSSDPNVQKKNRATNLERYGVEHNWNKGELRKRQEETMQKRYGVTHNWQSGVLRSKEKFKVSEGEKILMDGLDALGVSYKYRFYCERYPYECDFYLDQLDTFIEINISPFHDNHFFNPNSKEDVNKLVIIKQKAKDSSWYESKLRTWLKRR